MSLQLGVVLREGATNLRCRTGALLLGVYVAMMAGLLPLSNTIIVRVYETAGVSEAAAAIPLVLDIPISAAIGGYLFVTLVATYVSVVATRTFVADAPDSFPEGALTRKVPLAVLNVFVGGFVYSLLLFLGTVAFVIPGIIAYVAFMFMLPYIAVEDRNFVGALQSSYRLSKGHWLMLFVLLVIVISAAGLLGGIGGFVSALVLPPALSQLSIVLVQAPVSLYVLAVIAAAFNQLRDDDAEQSGPVKQAETPSTPA